MGMVPKRWIKWLAVVFGVAALFTPALFDLGWIPQSQSQNVVIFLLGFIVLDGAASKESSKALPAPELYTNSEDYYAELGRFSAESKHEVLIVLRGEDVSEAISQRAAERLFSTIAREKQLHVYLVVASRISELSEASVKRRLAIHQNPAYEGRVHYRFIDTPVTFGCTIYDQRHWSIDFSPNPADPRAARLS